MQIPTFEREVQAAFGDVEKEDKEVNTELQGEQIEKIINTDTDTQVVPEKEENNKDGITFQNKSKSSENSELIKSVDQFGQKDTEESPINFDKNIMVAKEDEDDQDLIANRDKTEKQSTLSPNHADYTPKSHQPNLKANESSYRKHITLRSAQSATKLRTLNDCLDEIENVYETWKQIIEDQKYRTLIPPGQASLHKRQNTQRIGHKIRGSSSFTNKLSHSPVADQTHTPLQTII